jgi:hypothetical protein
VVARSARTARAARGSGRRGGRRGKESHNAVAFKRSIHVPKFARFHRPHAQRCVVELHAVVGDHFTRKGRRHAAAVDHLSTLYHKKGRLQSMATTTITRESTKVCLLRAAMGRLQGWQSRHWGEAFGLVGGSWGK